LIPKFEVSGSCLENGRITKKEKPLIYKGSLCLNWSGRQLLNDRERNITLPQNVLRYD